MNDKIKVIMTCRFPSWEMGGTEYPAFGVKYLMEVSLDEWEKAEEVFKEKYKAKIGKDFEGEILFEEEVDLVNL